MNTRTATKADFKVETTLIDSEGNKFTLRKEYAPGIFECNNRVHFENEAKFYKVIETIITIYPGSAKGKSPIQLNDNIELSGPGISKDNTCGNLNGYWVTKNALNKLKTKYNYTEI